MTSSKMTRKPSEMAFDPPYSDIYQLKLYNVFWRLENKEFWKYKISGQKWKIFVLVVTAIQKAYFFPRNLKISPEVTLESPP